LQEVHAIFTVLLKDQGNLGMGTIVVYLIVTILLVKINLETGLQNFPFIPFLTSIQKGRKYGLN